MKQRILDHISEHGPMRFDEYMELCLYDPDDGFFSAGGVRAGSTGDFVTSPEVSPWFGRLIGRWVRSVSPQGAVLVEVGSGSGSLLAPLTAEAADVLGAVWAVEASASARLSTSEAVPTATVVSSIAEVPAGDVVVVMNEVLDNLPARLVQRDGDRWSEVLVDASEDILAFRSSTADDDLSAWCDAHLSAAPDGALLAAQIATERWVGDLVGRFPRGHLCIIDYAADTATLARRRRSDVVRAFHRQRSGMDVLDRPGTTDITVDVNTDVLVRALRAAGARVTLRDQARFLGDLGAGDVLASLTELGHERARAGDVMGQLQARSEATNLRALITVPGFGGFTVFLVRWGD